MAVANQPALPAKGPKKKFTHTVSKFFRETRAEFKKIVWPTKKQTLNNTVVVLIAMVLSGLFVWALDTLFVQILNLLLQRAA